VRLVHIALNLASALYYVQFFLQDLQEVGWGKGMDWIDLAQDRQFAGSCESGNGPSGSLKLGKTLE